MRVCIIGSCVSRDIFNHVDKEDAKVVLYIARNSLASIYASSPFVDVYSQKLKSPFQAKLVGMDIAKTSAAEINACDADVYLIDSIDDRFDLIQTPHGICTNSNELQTAAGSARVDGRVIRAGSQEFMKHWIDGWNKLIDGFEDRGLLHKVVINRVLCKQESVNGVRFGDGWVERLNTNLSRIYDIQERRLPRNQFIDYGASLTCPDNHQWGRAPYHFNKESQLLAWDWIRSHCGQWLQT